jgi:uncharacterized membrane protein YGL010W
VVPADIHDFFAASAGVAGALIGLLFVAISVAGRRLAGTEASAQLHRIRASAALIAFNNALAVSLFALLPGEIGGTSLSVALVGLAFVLASLLSLYRLRQVKWASVRDGIFLIGLVIIFVIQLVQGLAIQRNPAEADSVRTIAMLVIACFFVGIARAWELIGGPSIGITHEVVALVRADDPDSASPAEARSAASPDDAAAAAAAEDAAPTA